VQPNRYHIVWTTWLAVTVTVIAAGCLNPFAPGEADGDPFEHFLGNPSTIEGFYQRFQNAYQLRDTTLYGPLIHPEFLFSFRDFEQNVDITWGRAEEMWATYNLFLNSAEIQMQWNNILSRQTDEANTFSQVVRRFSLIVVLQGSDVLRTDGSANFVLSRADSTMNWQLISWRDESDL
jgi:hypothetical protein